MEDSRLGRRTLGRRLAGLLLTAFAASVTASSAAAGPQMTSFAHSVGFSFDYPTKWQLKRIQEGMMLIPHNAVRDSAGWPMELVIIGFVDTAGVTDPFEPSFANAFEQRYRSLVPSLVRTGDLDWPQSPLGTGLLVSYKDSRGNPHRLFCAVHGDLGIYLAHVAQRGTARPKTTALTRQIFSSFAWTESEIDPALVRSWTSAGNPTEAPVPAADRWIFATDGRLLLAPEPERGGYYSSFGGVLNILWDHGVEESYTYTVSPAPNGGPWLELRHPDGGALRLH